MVNVPFRTYGLNLPSSPAYGDAGFRLVADLPYIRVGTHSVSAQHHYWAFSVGSTRVYCFHLAVSLNSLLDVGPHQFLKSWSFLFWIAHFLGSCGLSIVCAPLISIVSFHLVQLVCLLAVPTGARLGGENPHPDTLPTGPFCEYVWQK